ncbi:MAG TPA: alkaline phosphatase family protein, partial [Vicinamibacterales bacterium]|nr:alkaline phosphatase family protein [Vicinamibacterales bacterium]
MVRRIACLIVLAAASWSPGSEAPAAAQEGPGPLRVYVVVLDGLKPEEVGALTPALSSLRARGTWYEQARAVFPAETLPNHVAMMTGMLPRHNGVIGNQYWHPNEDGAERFYMEEPSLLDADTVTTTLENECGARVSTATVLSKDYLYGVFRGEAPRPGDPNPQAEADFHWQAPFYIPASGHIPDTYTMDAFRTWIREQPTTLPQFAFVNLGDIDRAGHADEVGGATSGLTTPARQAAIEDTDAQLSLLIDDIEAAGAWDETVLILSSDHGMDWGPQSQSVDMQGALTAAGYANDDRGDPGALAGSNGDFVVVGGGGSGTIYVEDDEDVADMARIVSELPGVDFVATRDPVPGLATVDYEQIGLDHPNSGDITAFMEPHWHDGDSGNVLPGNHGHPPTQQS